MKKIIIKILIALVSFSTAVLSQEILYKGQLSGWLMSTEASLDKTSLGLRYIPELRLLHTLAEGKNIDIELSGNINTNAVLDSLSGLSDNLESKIYRAFIRYSATQFEARLGMQKINFGPARILRSLMWFDTLDPRDPLKLTEGVNGLLTRYYFFNNANVWVWGLYGNENLKGVEILKTDKEKLEYGGRFQFPFGKGEMAVTYNHRNIDIPDWLEKMSSTLIDGSENRIAFDGIWDVEVGLWFEAVVNEIKVDDTRKIWGKLLTLGTDYTFESGIHLLGEHFIMYASPETEITNPFAAEISLKLAEFSAIQASYSLGIVDSINAIGLYDWSSEKIYSFAGWQRTYDNWMFNLLAFANDANTAGSFTGSLAGNGIQFIVTYNH